MTGPAEFDLLWKLFELDTPSGDESFAADWLEAHISVTQPDVSLVRAGESLIAIRGAAPSVAVFAHTDTTGFTLGYDASLIPIGGPAPSYADPLRQIGQRETLPPLRLAEGDGDEWTLTGNAQPSPGTRLVYAAKPRLDGDLVTGPYLDNRCGVWAALEVLRRCPAVAVAFTAGEEHSGGGATICSRILYETYDIRQALISDITWAAEHVHIGRGPAISLRDRMIPSQRYLSRVLRVADESGLPYQREIESSGGSDAAYIQRSGYPIDWVFVGAPEDDPHTAHESLSMRDLRGMADLLVALVHGLSG